MIDYRDGLAALTKTYLCVNEADESDLEDEERRPRILTSSRK